MRKRFDRSLRLRNFSYASSRWYFITVCTHGRKCNLSRISGCDIHLSKFGTIVQEEWLATKELRPYVILGPTAIMPNHFHGLIAITLTEDGTAGGTLRQMDDELAKARSLTAASLSSICGAFKSSVTRRVNLLRESPGAEFWQKGFYEHIVRNEKEWEEIASYILFNPLNWHVDHENPDGVPRQEEVEFWKTKMGI